MDHYSRIARVIRYLDEHHFTQPDLSILARSAGLSPFHFHRLFSEWAGITPKDFLQCLSIAHARTMLTQGASVLKTALEVGFSGPGRLHDLCVNLESASPGELKSGGKGLTIAFGFADTPFGPCLMGESPRGVCHLSFFDSRNEGSALSILRKEWPHAGLSRDDAAAQQIVQRIFVQSPETRPLRAFVRGTDFQVRVWRALLQIPPGRIVTYKRLAETIGCGESARAVGTAVGKNPLAYLIPCHRVIRQTGVIGEYRWGRVRKRAMLAREGASPRVDRRKAVGRPNSDLSLRRGLIPERE